MFLRLAVAVGLTVCVGLATGGCTRDMDVAGNDPGTYRPADPAPNQPPRAHHRQTARPIKLPTSQQVEQPWECHYSVTYDRHWHNDVLCTNGVAMDRPYLRPGDSFITQLEIMESAREYEDQLNHR
jgi:hypothetical protein